MEISSKEIIGGLIALVSALVVGGIAFKKQNSAKINIRGDSTGLHVGDKNVRIKKK